MNRQEENEMLSVPTAGDSCSDPERALFFIAPEQEIDLNAEKEVSPVEREFYMSGQDSEFARNTTCWD